MPLNKQLVSVGFQTGIDTKTNPKLVQGKLLELVNGEVLNGQVVKSPGYISLAKNQTINSDPLSPKALVPFDENLLVVDNGNIYLYDQGSDSLIEKAKFPYLQQQTHNIESGLNALNNTFSVISASFGDYFAEIHLIAGSPNRYELNIFNSKQSINVLYIADFFSDATYTGLLNLKPVELIATPVGIFVYSIDSLGSISEDIISYNTLTRTITLSILTSVVNYVPATNVSYYHVMVGRFFDGKIFLGYRQGAAATAILYITIRDQYGNNIRTIPSVSTVVDLTANIVNNNLTCEIKAIGSTTSFIILYATQFFIYDVYSETQTNTFSYPGGEVYQTYSVSYLADTNEIVTLKHAFDETTTTSNTIAPLINRYSLTSSTWTVSGNTPDSRFTTKQWGNCWLAGGMYTTNNEIFFPVYYFPYIPQGTGVATPEIERRATIFLMNSEYIVVSNLVPLTASLFHVAASISKVPSAGRSKPNVNNASIYYPFYNDATLTLNNDDYRYSYQILASQITNETTEKISSWPRGKSVYLGLSQMFEYSAYGFYEQNFYDFPQLSIKGSALGGSLVPGNSYSYQMIFEWINGEGELVRSAPSIAKSDTLAGGLNSYEIFYTVPPFFTNRKNQKIKIYRTSANGTLYQLVQTISQNVTNPPFTAGATYYVTYDGVSDSSIGQNEIIYTTGNVLGAFPFQSSAGFVLHNNRIFSITANDANVIQYSKPYAIGVALESSPLLTFVVEPRGGDCIQLASLDDKLIIFKRDYIYFVIGDGADAVGNNTTLSRPELVNSPVGCSEALSVIRTPVGIMFKSRKGIYLLDRSLSVSYIGADVEIYNQNEITSANLLQTVNKVKFTTQNGVILIYDYYYNTWSTEDNFNIASASLYQGEFTAITTTGQILKQDPRIYTRDNSNYKLKMRTAWIKLSGLQGYQRIYRILFLGDYKGSHLLRVGLLYDYVDAVQEFKYFDPTNALGIKNSYGDGNWGQVVPFGGLNSSVYQFRINPSKQKCEAIQIVIEDYFDNSIYDTGNSFTITDMTFVVGIIGGEYRLPVTQRN